MTELDGEGIGLKCGKVRNEQREPECGTKVTEQEGGGTECRTADPTSNKTEPESRDTDYDKNKNKGPKFEPSVPKIASVLECDKSDKNRLKWRPTKQ